MYPWLWFWAPHVHLPWSGDVAQQIEPSTQWFFGSIKPGAGNARIEEKAFAVASYGKQLGHIAEVLIDLAERSGNLGPQAADSLEELRRIRAEIDEVKKEEYALQDAELAAAVQKARRQGGERYEALARRLAPLLAGSGA